MSWELAGAAFKLIMAGMEPVKDAPIARHGYWRIGGQAITDEAPEEDFPLEDDVIVKELL